MTTRQRKKAAPKTRSKARPKKTTKRSQADNGQTDPQQAWNKRRGEDHTKRGRGEDDRVDPGDYVASISRCNGGVDKNGNPYLSFNMIVKSGSFKGSKVSSPFFTSASKGKALDVNRVDRLFEVVQKLGYDTIELNPTAEDMQELALELTAEKPDVNIHVAHNDEYQNVYINSLV